MRYAKIKENDVANGPGIRVSLFVQGCHFHCPECFNQETWSFEGGIESTWQNVTEKLLIALRKNGVSRGLTILGGEPLCEENRQDVSRIIMFIRQAIPDISIWLWTGYYLKDLYSFHNGIIDNILNNIDVLVDGPYIAGERDLSLKWRGSRNQQIHYLKESK